MECLYARIPFDDAFYNKELGILVEYSNSLNHYNVRYIVDKNDKLCHDFSEVYNCLKTILRKNKIEKILFDG